MIWCNKNKNVRRSEWFVVPPPQRHRMQEAHTWCKDQPSSGKFYHHYTNTRWWFECEEDAVFFALKWSGQ